MFTRFCLLFIASILLVGCAAVSDNASARQYCKQKFKKGSVAYESCVDREYAQARANSRARDAAQRQLAQDRELEQRVKPMRDACTKFGFQSGTDAHSDCVLEQSKQQAQIELQRRAQQSALIRQQGDSVSEVFSDYAKQRAENARIRQQNNR